VARKAPPLIVEPVDASDNCSFITMIEHKKKRYTCVVDNLTRDEVRAFVLEFAEPSGVSIDEFMTVAIKWFYSAAKTRPLSMEIASLGLTEKLSPMLRSFDVESITRFVGQAFTFDIGAPTRVKRRRVVPIHASIEIHLKK